MKKGILLSLVFCVALQIPTFAADVFPSIIPEAGTINTHDLETLKQQQIEQQVQEDFKNYEKRKKEGKIKPEKQKKIKAKVEKAKVDQRRNKRYS